jgi:hypothetical protein
MVYGYRFLNLDNIIHSHSYAFTTRPTPRVTLIHANIATMRCFEVSIVGVLTSIQFIVTKKYLIHDVALTDLLDFYKFNNPCYKHEEITTPPKNVFSYILITNPNYFKTIT